MALEAFSPHADCFIDMPPTSAHHGTFGYGGALMTFTQNNQRAAKLTGEQVVEIRERYALEGVSQAQLSREFQVTIGTIRNILNGTTWQNITAGTGLPKRPRNAPQKALTEDEAREAMERLSQIKPETQRQERMRDAQAEALAKEAFGIRDLDGFENGEDL